MSDLILYAISFAGLSVVIVMVAAALLGERG